ncbi:hypothetical protein TeGR_g14399 [Tetraparma gracilis]|uniref:Uncharacterized protein n=1 Tax=Tetraparma gracilis TaxID=2962635 RepID=A0ABQ6MKD2_9STRA|nr:hypothetical protein TeGR_g14399 [Tetraparma gracilis]
MPLLRPLALLPILLLLLLPAAPLPASLPRRSLLSLPLLLPLPSLAAPKPTLPSATAAVLSLPPLLDSLQLSCTRSDFPSLLSLAPLVRSLLPSFVSYIDLLPPPSPAPLLRREAGLLFASCGRLRAAAVEGDPGAATRALGLLMLHYDRFLRGAGLLEGGGVDRSELFGEEDRRRLVFQEGRVALMDRVLLVGGAEMGRTGTVVGDESDGEGPPCFIVRLDMRGVREVVVARREWVKRRIGEQEPDEVFVGKAAARG